MISKEMRLRLLTVASAIIVGGSLAVMSPASAVFAAGEVVTEQATTSPKMSMGQVYAGLDVRTEGVGNIGTDKADFGSVTSCFIANKIGWNLCTVNAVTLEGKVISYRYLNPDVIDAWGQQNKGIAHGGGDVPAGQPAWYSLRVWPTDLTTANFTADYWNAQVQGDADFTGYTDFVDEGDTIRGVYSFQQNGMFGLYCEVLNKTTGKVTAFQYEERTDLYDDTRALTVIYSCLPQ